jgi:uncharacterized protein (DUF934 family)
MKIIRKRSIVEDDFRHLADGEPPPDAGKIIVGLARWLEAREVLLGSHAAVGVRMGPDKLPKDLPDLQRAALIAIEFPRFTEGRGYSVARLLRERERYRGEVRAIGWITRDLLRNLERAGFDAYELKPGKPLESALEGFGEIGEVYQASVEQPLPLFRRR